MVKVIHRNENKTIKKQKTMENVRKHKESKSVTITKRRNYFVSEPNYHSAKFFIENLLAIEMGKTQIFINKPVLLEIINIRIK